MPETEVSTYALLSRLPLFDFLAKTKPFDLHTLGMPLALILSQDQTLHKTKKMNLISMKMLKKLSFDP
jgi:hypothetical protein